ncbi:MAG: type II toxin-antitoxin system RelE/ParE family toxin [Planctomycetota bacterium]|jgi:plasmid stabilization system protein ParE
MARLIWSPQAVEDLDGICRFIARDSERYASEFASRVVLAVEVLRRFPRTGRMVPEFGAPELREVLVGHYRVLYEIAAEEVRILAVHHGARLLRERPRSD